MIPITADSIASIGFPILMCCYLVFKFEKTLTQNTEMMKKLIQVIQIGNKK